jgi:geranylgeranyl diphosphate synthase type II
MDQAQVHHHHMHFNAAPVHRHMQQTSLLEAVVGHIVVPHMADGPAGQQGIAVLAGDALLTQAFEIAALSDDWPRYSHRDIVLEIARASGSLQLIAGQVADLEGEGRDLSVPELKYIHERKTSALLCASVRLGGMSANCTPAQLKALTTFGYNVGLAFQVIDDILDVTQTSEKLGKTAGKDVAAQKATYPRLVGLEKSRKIAAQLTARAFDALKPFKRRAPALEALAHYLLKREN